MNRNEPDFGEDVHAIACERLPAEGAVKDRKSFRGRRVAIGAEPGGGL